MILIKTHVDSVDSPENINLPEKMFIIDAYDLMIKEILEKQNEGSLHAAI